MHDSYDGERAEDTELTRSEGDAGFSDSGDDVSPFETLEQPETEVSSSGQPEGGSAAAQSGTGPPTAGGENPETRDSRTEGQPEVGEFSREVPESPFAPVAVGELPREGLTAEEIESIQSETGWSPQVIGALRSRAEAELYESAELQEQMVDGKVCLVRSDINLELRDEFGRTNAQRMEKGICPLSAEGERVELHHIGQREDSPLAELTFQWHRSREADSILHNKTLESEIDRSEFAKERASHWKARYESLRSDRT